MQDLEQQFKDAIDKFLEALSGPRRGDPFDAYARLVGPVEAFSESASTPLEHAMAEIIRSALETRLKRWAASSHDLRAQGVAEFLEPGYKPPERRRPTILSPFAWPHIRKKG